MMRPKCSSLLALAVAVMAALVPLSASAWSNGGYSADLEDPDYGTHDWIADMALEVQVRDLSFLQTTYHTEYLIGTEAPDNPEFIGDSVEHHVYYYASGGLQDDSSADRASAMYGLALDDLGSGDFSAAAYHIGAMAHYISDVGVFGHTMGAYTDWGAEVHHSDYEGEFESILDALEPPPKTSLGNMSAYDSAAELARDITFGSGEIMPNTWMDDNYDWSDGVFADSAMASLHAAVSAVAAAVNHLMYEAGHEEPADGGDDGAEDGDEEEPEDDGPTVPDAPRSVAAYVDHGSVVVTWAVPASDGGEPLIEYRVFRATGTGASELVGTVSSLTLLWTDDGVEQGGTYSYQVAARNSVGTGPLSYAVTLTLPEDDGTSLLLPAAASAALAALVSAAALALRRRSRGRAG